MRVICDTRLIRLREQTSSADQHFVLPWLVPMIDLYANVGALEHSHIFDIGFRRTLERPRSGVQHFVRPSFVPMIDLRGNDRALERARNF